MRGYRGARQTPLACVHDLAQAVVGFAPGCSVGIFCARKSAMTTKIASTASADCSPEMRAAWYAETAASDCLGGTFASSSAAFRSASEMNGTPPAGAVCACDCAQ